MQTIIGANDPQKIFWKESDASVPKDFADDLVKAFGTDQFGDPLLRVRWDAQRFPEGMWIVEEKWHPDVFGSIEEWNRSKVMYEAGIRYDFGDFPSRGIYAAIMMWADYEGRPKPLSPRLIENLQQQRRARETKGISAAQVMADEMEREARAEAQQRERRKEIETQLAEDMKKDKEKIFSASTRKMFEIGKSTPKNIITLN